MPPKKQQEPPPVEVPKNFIVHCELTRPNQDLPVPAGNPPSFPSEGIRLRIFSTWNNTNSVTTPIFGTKDSPSWTPKSIENQNSGEDSSNDISSKETISFSYEFTGLIDDNEQLKSFHSNPGIYCVVFHANVNRLVAVNFVHLDCSMFVAETGVVQVHRKVYQGYELSLKVSCNKCMMQWPSLLPLEPVMITLKGLNNFPIYEGEAAEDAIHDSYLYGMLKIGSSFQRQLLLFPSNNSAVRKESLSETTGTTAIKKKNRYSLETKVCLLPGLSDLPRFRDHIASSTFVIELHQDDLMARCFTQKNMEEYSALLAQEPGGVGLPLSPDAAPAVPEKGKKPAPAAAAAAAAVAANAPYAPVLGPNANTASDKFLLEIINGGLKNSKMIRPHGTARFRLEQLLEQANDLLTKFRRKRVGASQDDDHVVIQEDMALEVRLEKPSHPEKWDLPNDLSLKSALQRAVEARGVTSGSSRSGTVRKSPPRHELFLINNCYLSVNAALHRKLHEDVAQVDTASPFPVQVTKASSGKSVSAESAAAPAATAATAVSLGETAAISSEGIEGETPLQRTLRETPFTRMLVLFKYSDDVTLRSISDGIAAVNSRALPNIQGSIRSYSLSAEEREQSVGAALDLVSGFMIIDDDMRLVVLEGLAAPDCGMELLFLDYLPRVKDNDSSLKILCNPEVLFSDRIYPDYSPDLKRIRVRGKLQKLARRPEIYNRKQVEEICFEAVDGLMALRRAEDLRSTKSLDMYPSADSLNKLELLYGEAISRADMDGRPLSKKGAASLTSGRATSPSAGARTATPSQAQVQAQATAASETRGDAEGLGATTSRRRSEYVPTDCRNPTFEDYLQSRPAHRIDHIAENRALRKQAWLDMLRRREARDKVLEQTVKTVLGTTAMSASASRRESGDKLPAPPGSQSQSQSQLPGQEKPPKIYLYSNMSENYKSKAWEQLRSRVAQDKNATYTFSQDFVSQTVCVVDEEKEEKKQKALNKSLMLTEKGFQYPKPKTRKELMQHPQRPSEARVEELKEPFLDATDMKKGAAAESEVCSPTTLAREKGYKTQIRPSSLFGALEEPVYETEFTLKLVGDRQTLPRGNLVAGDKPNPDFFRSVHLGGENQARIVEEALEKEKADWKAKVVVEDTAFKVGGFKVRDVAIPANRAQDILKDDPKTIALKKLREVKSHTGRPLGYTTAPLTLMNLEPYAPQAGQKLLQRAEDRTKFITAQHSLSNQGDLLLESGGAASVAHPLDFTRYIHEGTNKPHIVTMIAKRKHPPQDPSSAECTGPKWNPAPSS